MNETLTIDRDACIAGWCAGEEWCPITCTMDFIGNKWPPNVRFAGDMLVEIQEY